MLELTIQSTLDRIWLKIKIIFISNSQYNFNYILIQYYDYINEGKRHYDKYKSSALSTKITFPP